jgi:hypothetical protein
MNYAPESIFLFLSQHSDFYLLKLTVNKMTLEIDVGLGFPVRSRN